MISRLLISAGARTLNKPMVQRLVVRQVHKGPDGAPPMRWTSVPVVNLFKNYFDNSLSGKDGHVLVYLLLVPRLPNLCSP